jgi:hypothetical protein
LKASNKGGSGVFRNYQKRRTYRSQMKTPFNSTKITFQCFSDKNHLLQHDNICPCMITFAPT